VLSAADVAATGAPCLTQPGSNWVQQQYDGLRDHPIRRQDVAWLGSGNLAVKRAAFDRVGGFDASLTACEDVDFCNRLAQSGGRIVADPNLRSVHFGDPRTLRALFFGELWRGRGNLRVTFNGPRTFRHLRSAMVPVAQLLGLAGCIAALVAGHPTLAAVLLTLALIPAGWRAGVMISRQLHRSAMVAAQAIAVAVIFDLARALALVARGSHRARRTV
jgi:GT2 family glycosyltransferase